jgi:phage RecT family recombinase
MAGTEIAQRTPEQNLVTFIRSDAVVEQLAMVLPPTVTLDRFLRITTTAILTNPDIAKLDPHTVGRALTQAAADGLMPDGKQGAIVGRGGKAVWQPMIGGFRSILAEFGWTLKTKTVYAGDRFEWQDEPPSRLHQQVRPGGERGDIIGAYAVLSHRDGRELQMFMPWADIAKRREVATTKAVWDRWPAEMSEKTVGRAIFKIAPLAEADRERLARVFDSTEIDPDEATEVCTGRHLPRPDRSPPPRRNPRQTDGRAWRRTASRPAALLSRRRRRLLATTTNPTSTTTPTERRRAGSDRGRRERRRDLRAAIRQARREDARRDRRDRRLRRLVRVRAPQRRPQPDGVTERVGIRPGVQARAVPAGARREGSSGGMSTVEHDQQVESKSTIRVSLNAKREAQFEVKVVQGVTDPELADLRRQAVASYRELCRELGVAS